MIENLQKFGQILTDVSLKKYNTYKIGGNAKYIFFPNSEEDLIESLKLIKKNNIPYLVLGNGSNVILSDNDYNGIIIKLDNLKDIRIDGTEVYAQAGVMMPKLANLVINNNLKGLEWSNGIPATFGGCVHGNAGAYKECIFDYLKTVKVLDKDLNIKVLNKDDIKYDYRYTEFEDNRDYIILGATLELEESNKEELQEIVKKRFEKRKETQPLDYPSAGSVFRNPENDAAGRIIEQDVKLKGTTIGGAKISEKHANFIINVGEATSKDIKELISLIQKKVKEKDNIDLILEQEIINWE